MADRTTIVREGGADDLFDRFIVDDVRRILRHRFEPSTVSTAPPAGGEDAERTAAAVTLLWPEPTTAATAAIRAVGLVELHFQ
jgi:hypothetical protein